MSDFSDDEKSGEKKSSEFARMLEDFFKSTQKKISPGDKIKSEVLSISKDDIIVSTGTMHDGMVKKKELLDLEGKLNCKVGDVIELYVTQVRGSEIYLSPHPTARNIADNLEDAYDMMLPLEGRVTEVCKGGFRVSVMGKSAFCPLSQMDLKKIDVPEDYIGKRYEFLITRFTERGRNIVVSRRKFLEEQKGLLESAFTEERKEGDILKGRVTKIEKFGAFVELTRGIEGLLHVSEMSWSRVADPSEVVSIGQEVTVKLLKVDSQEGRLKISVSMKQAGSEPWQNLPIQIRVGHVIEGKVTRCLKFGAFVKLIPGVEGLIPLSEMSYTKRVLRSNDLIHEGERVAVMVKEIYPEERRVLLSLKDAGADPWALVSQKFPIGSIILGRVDRREPYGLLIQLQEGVIGLLPKSKALEEPGFPFEKLRVGDEVTLQVGELNLEDRRITLKVPQDPAQKEWKDYAPGQAASFGTLGDQFRQFFDKKKKTSS